MRVVLPYLGPLADAARAEPAVALARALARRGHELHVLCRGDVVPADWLPAAVHHWMALGPAPELPDAAPPLSLHLFSKAAGTSRDGDALREFTARIRADVVLADAGDPGADDARELARPSAAPLALRWDGQAAPANGDPTLRDLVDAAAVVFVPGAEAHRRLVFALGEDLPHVLELGDGVDAAALAPPARGALDGTPCPPLEPGERCVLVEAESLAQGTLAAAALALGDELTARRRDLRVLVTAREDGQARTDGGRVLRLGPLEHAARRALRARARVALLDDGGSATSPRRLHECVAAGVLPMAREGGGLGEGLAPLLAQLPRSLAEALALPPSGEVPPAELRARLEYVLDHPDAPHLAPRLASFAQRTFDWSIRSLEYERALRALLVPATP